MGDRQNLGTNYGVQEIACFSPLLLAPQADLNVPGIPQASLIRKAWPFSSKVSSGNIAELTSAGYAQRRPRRL